MEKEDVFSYKMDWLDILEDPKKKKKEQANEKKANDDEQYQAPFELMSEVLTINISS